MTWRIGTEIAIGNNYTKYEPTETSIEFLPLLYCIGQAFPARNTKKIDYYVDSLLNYGGAGGDPEWHIERLDDERDKNGNPMYWARTSTDMSGLEPCTGTYTEATVKKYFAKTMREYARVHPANKAEIEMLIERYKLEPTGE